MSESDRQTVPFAARLLDGKALAAEVRAEVAARAARFVAAHGRRPGLDVVIVGDDPASHVYVRNKEKAATEAGLRSTVHRLAASTTQAELLALVRRLGDDPAVDGILVQLPLPKPLDEAAVIDATNPDKDVDGFHPVSAGRLATGRPGFVACTPRGCMRLLGLALGKTGADAERVDLAGKRAVVVGRSSIVGKPMAQLLLAAHATVTVAHSRTRELDEVCREADVLVVAVGRPELVRGAWIKPGAVVIDVGTNRVPTDDGKGRLVGDVAFGEACAVASAITPVPGGVGPMTIAYLLVNTLDAAERAEARRRA